MISIKDMIIVKITDIIKECLFFEKLFILFISLRKVLIMFMSYVLYIRMTEMDIMVYSTTFFKEAILEKIYSGFMPACGKKT